MDLLSFPVSVHKFEIFYDMGHVWIHEELSLIYLNTKKLPYSRSVHNSRYMIFLLHFCCCFHSFYQVCNVIFIELFVYFYSFLPVCTCLYPSLSQSGDGLDKICGGRKESVLYNKRQCCKLLCSPPLIFAKWVIYKIPFNWFSFTFCIFRLSPSLLILRQSKVFPATLRTQLPLCYWEMFGRGY